MELFENDSDHGEMLRKTGFWGAQGAGCLILAADTGRLCFTFRSESVEQPHTYGTFGGAIDRGHTPEQTVRKEVSEESGYDGRYLDLIPLYKFEVPNFKYHNFLAVIELEFDPIDTWESEGHAWVDYGNWPKPLHFGSIKLLNDGPSNEAIKNAIKKYAPHKAKRLGI